MCRVSPRNPGCGGEEIECAHRRRVESSGNETARAAAEPRDQPASSWYEIPNKASCVISC